jgi:hypothetical protein
LPETVLAPSHTEASALPRAPLSPVTEQNPFPVQEVRHEVNICTQFRYLFISQHS